MERIKSEPEDPCAVKLWNPLMESTGGFGMEKIRCCWHGEEQAWSRLCDGERQASGTVG